MEKLLEILKSIKPGVDFEKSEDMIEEGLIDSFDVVSIVAKINEEFDIDFTVSEIIPENFKTPKTLYDTIERIRNS